MPTWQRPGLAGRQKRHEQEKKGLCHAAVARRVRPRREAAHAPGADGNPDLLERAPVVRRPLVAEEPASVGRLEGEVHLQAAPIGRAGIRPAPLVVMDADPSAQLGWMVRAPPGPVLPAMPAPRELSK